MFKWAEIGVENNHVRFELLRDILTENQFQNEVDFIEVKDTAEFDVIFYSALKKYDGIRIGRGLGELVVPLWNKHSLMVDKIKAADAVVKDVNDWWLRTNAVEGFGRVLRRIGEKFDLLSWVLVIGSGAAARVAVTSLFIAGFKNFSISSLDENKVQEFVDDLSKSHIGAKFRVIPKSDLILLPSTHGMLVNTTPMIEDNPMLKEIYYFNFFKSGGLAIDFSILPVETPLLRGARDVGAFCVSGYQISAMTDIIWCEQITGRSIDSKNYEARLLEKLKTLES